MEKILKTGQPAKKLNDVKKERDHETVQNYEVTRKSQSDVIKQAEPQPLNKSKTNKPLPHVSEGLKKFMENQNILDSLSPWFIKTILKSILDFIKDELSASKIFSNLAPIESRFLENFLSIFRRKEDLEVLLSPACNEILAEISNCFGDFNKICRLEISSIGVNSKTNKREVKYTKVPVFQSIKKAKQKLNEHSIQTKTTSSSTNDTTKLENMPSISKKEYNITVEKKMSEDTNKSKSNNQAKILPNSTIGDDRLSISQPIDKVIKNKDNNIVKAVSTFVKKPEDVKPKTNLNKSELLPKKSISFTKEGTSSTANTPCIRAEQKSSKMKILQDMTIPVTSEIGTRMMQLMGWQGGALGLRGDGITEPIIPKPNFNTRGLGHVPVKNDSNKATKNSNKETKKQIRSEFVNKILKMINNDIKVSVIRLQDKLINREIQFMQLTLNLINRRRNLDMELDNRIEIIDKMVRNMNIMFNVDFEDGDRKIIITKTSKTQTQALQRDTKKDTNCEKIETNEIQNSISKATLKTIILKAILELIKSRDDEKIIKFNKELKVNRIIYTNTIILLINERQYITEKKNKVVAELGSQVLKAIGDIFLSIKIYENERYIVIRKHHPRSNVDLKINKTAVKKAQSDDNNKSAFDDVRNYLPVKKKNKLLNALYRYEIQHTEEFKENRWYNTVNKSLLDTEKMCNIIDDTKFINKNNKRKIEFDENNNGGISVTFKT